MRKSTQVLKARNSFIKRFGRKTYNALVWLAQPERATDAVRQGIVTTTSLVTYRANLTRGCYKPWVGANFTNDTMNLHNSRR